MLATFSPENQIARILDEIGCAPSNFCEIANRHSNARVLAALQGRNDFSAEDGQYYLRFARQMKKLAEEYPVPIAWKETTRIKEILASRTQGRPTPFHIVQFYDGTLFAKMENGEPVRTTDYDECAAIGSFETARTIAQLLDRMGHLCRYTMITNHRRENILDSVRDFGFEQ
jgi:hypothetical protein